MNVANLSRKAWNRIITDMTQTRGVTFWQRRGRIARGICTPSRSLTPSRRSGCRRPAESSSSYASSGTPWETPRIAASNRPHSTCRTSPPNATRCRIAARFSIRRRWRPSDWSRALRSPRCPPSGSWSRCPPRRRTRKCSPGFSRRLLSCRNASPRRERLSLQTRTFSCCLQVVSCLSVIKYFCLFLRRTKFLDVTYYSGLRLISPPRAS